VISEPVSGLLPTAIPDSILENGSSFKLEQLEKPTKQPKATRQIRASWSR